MPQATIVLLTDFGTRDAYVGMVKGVLASLAPEARWIDLTHGIPPGDVRAAAFTLWQVQDYLPPGAIVLAVVDPGVGTSRGAIAVRLPRGLGVGPDNGLFSWILGGRTTAEAVTLDPGRFSPISVSATFHGRDVFAPAAARLALGHPLSDLGPSRSDLVRLPPPRLVTSPDGWQGEVLWIDTFGNAITSLGPVRLSGERAELEPGWRDGPTKTFLAAGARVVLPTGQRLPLKRTFGEVPADAPLAYVGSSGLVEIAVNGGRADVHLGLAPGQTVTLAIEG